MSIDWKLAPAPRKRAVPARILALTAACCLAFSLAPASASAHGISGRASLPVPAWLFAWAAAIVLVISFALLSTMWSRPRLQDGHERRLYVWPAGLSIPAGVDWPGAVRARPLRRI